MSGFLYQAFVFLCAAVIAVPVAKRLGLGSVLGYLIAGIVIGPILQLVGTAESQDIQHFAEFGVVIMLFIVGLELEPRALWAMRTRLLGLGGLQVGLTAAAVTGVALLFAQPMTIAIAIGLVFALSSTAIVLQTLNEKGLMKSDGGQSSFSVLLFQDIAVIPMLALIPLLAIPELVDLIHHADHGDDHGHGGDSFSLVDGLPGWGVALVTLGAVGVVVVGGSYLSRPMFRFIASAELREVFTIAALFLVVGIANLMTLVGLSPALGTFLAGVVLANSEFRHELESDIEPFRGLLLGLFFITVGAGIDFGLFFSQFGLIIGLTFGLIALKMGILLILARFFGLTGSDKWLFAMGLAQAGEFGFVLLSFTVQNGVIPVELSQTLLMVVAISMLLTPLLFIFYDQFIVPKFDDEQGREDDDIDETGVVIVAGIGRVGQIVNRMLRGSGHETVVLDLSAKTVERMSRFGMKTFFGDASRPDLLHAAGLSEAKMLVVAIDDRERTLEMVKHARMERPDIHIVARAYDRTDVYELYQAGANDIIRETFDSAVRMGRSALEAFGMHPYEAQRSADRFIQLDRRSLVTMAALYDPDRPMAENPEALALAQKLREEEGEALRSLRDPSGGTEHRAWLPPGHRPEEDDVAAE